MSKDSYKRIISCAITGAIHTPTMSPYLPISPDQIARSAIEAADAGAASVHIHARDPQTGRPSPDLNLYREIIEKIRAKNKDVIICLTTGGSLQMSVDERVAVVPEFKPELASMNTGSLNWGLFPMMEKYKEWKFSWEGEAIGDRDVIFRNTFDSIERMLAIMEKCGTKPELEVYDVGHLYNIAYLMQAGKLKGPIFIQFVTGILGGIGSTTYDIMNLHQTADRLFGRGNYQWSVIGAGKAEYPDSTTALFLGGNCRVGLEDNLNLGRGVPAKSNGELVEKMVRIMKEFDFEPATPAEARELLGITSK